MKKLLLFSFLLLSHCKLLSFKLDHSLEQKDENSLIINIPISLEPQELINNEHIILSIDDPECTLKNWSIDKKPVFSFNETLQENINAYNQSFIITACIEKNNTPLANSGSLHVTIASSKNPEPQEILIPFSFSQSVHQSEESNPDIEKATNTPLKIESSDSSSLLTKITSFSYKESIKKILIETNSLTLQLFLAFILGLLLSLTPCIYPMIPITLGVLQSQTHSSFIHNFFIAFSYTVGLATTFSLMGLLAASSGQAFGYLMTNPIFVIFIVLFLCYFAFSLFGFYNLYIPRFMQNKNSISGSGSALSAFFFGMASGSVASPCVSPGLALILTIVAALGSKFLGFLLLFAFGFGISTPLLIIGTFSRSMTLLPKAGMWMLEIQKIFGFMLLAMALYYLNNILPFYIIMALTTLLFFYIGIHYFYFIKNEDTFTWKIIKNLIGFAAIITAVMTGIQAVQAWYHPQEIVSFESAWFTDYEEALTEARNSKKLLFIDTWTPYCSICKGITNKILKSNVVSEVLKTDYVILSVDASDAFVEPYASIKKEFGVSGVPYLIIIDPVTKKEIAHWQSEMYDMSTEDVAKIFKNLVQQ